MSMIDLDAPVGPCNFAAAHLAAVLRVRLAVRVLSTIVLIAGVWGLGIATPARAALSKVVATPRHLPVAPPALTGNRGVAWVTQTSANVQELWESTRRGNAKRVQRFVTVPGYAYNSRGVFTVPYLSASSTHVGLELVKVYNARDNPSIIRVQTYLGELGKPLRQVSDCPVEHLIRSVDLTEGASAIFRGPACGQATIRDLGLGAQSDRRIHSDVFGMRIAPPFEAWLEPTAPPAVGATLVVRNGRKGAELTRMSSDIVPSDLSLRADGAVALLYSRLRVPAFPERGYEKQVAVVDPGATKPRALPASVLVPRLSRWTGTKLGIAAADRPHSTKGVLRLIDDQGRTTRRIANLGRDGGLMFLTDVNATRAAWVTRGCKSAQIRVLRLSASGTARHRPDRCRLRLARAPKITGGRLRLGVSCAGFTFDCTARLIIRVGRRVIARGTAFPRDRAPHYARANLRIGRKARALLQRQRRVRVRISGRIGLFPLGPRKQIGEVTRRTTTAIRR